MAHDSRCRQISWDILIQYQGPWTRDQGCIAEICYTVLNTEILKMVPKLSWTTFRWIFPDGYRMVEKCSENGPRVTLHYAMVKKMLEKWSQGDLKPFLKHLSTISGPFPSNRGGDLWPPHPKGAAAFGRRPLWVFYLKKKKIRKW